MQIHNIPASKQAIKVATQALGNEIQQICVGISAEDPNLTSNHIWVFDVK